MDVFSELTIDGLREEIEPERLGRRAGERGMPPLEAAEDPGQTEVAEFIEAKKNEAARLRDERLEQVDRHLHSQGQTVLAGDMEAAVQEAAAAFREIEQRELPNLKRDWFEFETQRRDFFDFKQKHDLDRAAHYPTQRMTLILIAVVVLVFVIESGLNGAFLAVGSEGGLVGGWGLALGFSIVNLVLPFLFFGPCSRYVSHVHPVLKAVGVLAILGWLAVATSLNLGLAHFRDASADLSENAGAQALSSFRAAPLGLQDAESWLLFVLGFFFSGVAFFDGRKLFGDPYPGYSAKHKRMEAARHDYEDSWQEVVEQLSEVREQGLDKVRRSAHQARSQPVERRRARDTETRLLSAFEAHLEQLQRFGTMLIEEYREANRTARFDRGEPMAFAKAWKLEPPPPVRGGAAADGAGKGSPIGRSDGAPDDTNGGAELAALNRQYEDAFRRIREEWEQAQNRIEAEAGMGRARSAPGGAPGDGGS